MPSHLIHVRPSKLGLWAVQPDDLDLPLSEHTNETEAERAAIQQAAVLDDAAVVIHDRYMRVRILRPGAGRARARPPSSMTRRRDRPESPLGDDHQVRAIEQTPSHTK